MERECSENEGKKIKREDENLGTGPASIKKTLTSSPKSAIGGTYMQCTARHAHKRPAFCSDNRKLQPQRPAYCI